MKRIIISTDCALDRSWHDPDDSLALLYLLKNPDLRVDAIISSFGNTDEVNVFKSLKKVSKATGVFVPLIHGAKNKNDKNPEFKLFLNKIEKIDYLFSIGPLTNLSFLGKDDLDKFEEVFVMGGAVDARGNFPPFFKTEFNFFKDKESLKYVFDNRQINLIPLDATRGIYLNKKMITIIKSKWPEIGKRVEKWNRLSKFLFRLPGAIPYDLIAAFAITNPEIFEIKNLGIKIIKGRSERDENSRKHDVFYITNPELVYNRIENWLENIF